MAVTVRWLDEDDWELLRELRLRSLADAPEAFTSTVERETVLTPDDWRSRTSNSAVAFTDEQPKGMAVFITDGAKGQLVGMWVAPEARGTGAAAALVDAVAARAGEKRQPLWLCVYVDNPRAKRFYERYGFVADGETCDITGTLTLVEMKLLKT
jgi:ribosomal protein S18 acetylase RimI-like enzyme